MTSDDGAMIGRSTPLVDILLLVMVGGVSDELTVEHVGRLAAEHDGELVAAAEGVDDVGVVEAFDVSGAALKLVTSAG